MWNEYQLLLDRDGGHPLFGNSNTASIANRISYVYNLHGPSLVIDTLAPVPWWHCIWLAKVFIRRVCLCDCRWSKSFLHPSKYINMSALGFLSSDGRCRSFGEGGDGYVPGEGVGAVLLKPLQKALEDCDPIYGVIKGSSLNHGGKTNGFYSPNPEAQAVLIQQALQSRCYLPEA